MAGLGEMLQGGPQGMGLPPKPPADEGEMGPAPPDQGAMSMQDAIGILHKYGITPDKLPEVAQALFTIIQAQQGGDQGAPPPGQEMAGMENEAGGAPPPGM